MLPPFIVDSSSPFPFPRKLSKPSLSLRGLVFLSCLKSFIRHPKVFNTVDPGSEVAGVTNKAIEAFRGRLKTARKSPG